jgi:hypothetical protein
VKNYESTLLSARNLSEVAIRRGLGIGIGGELTSWHPGPANLAPIECSKVCSVISAYRLLDVVAMLGGVHGARAVERCFFEIPNSSFRVGATSYTFYHLKNLPGNGQTIPLAVGVGQFPVDGRKGEEDRSSNAPRTIFALSLVATHCPQQYL